jgi:hypothetical protein
MYEAGDLVIARTIVWDLGRTGAHAQLGQDVLYEAGDLVIARSADL